MSVSISMVPTSRGVLLLRAAIQNELRRLWPAEPEFDDEEDGDSDVIAYSCEDAHILYALMPGPIPANDVDAILEATYLWPDAAGELRGHEGHVIVTVMSELPAAERLRILTVATAALLGACEQSLGVFWCDSFMFVSPDMFADLADDVMTGKIPLLLWVNFRVGSGPNGKSIGCTRGLTSVGLMEIETLDSPEPVGELRERLLGLAEYLIENGPVLHDGNTIGETMEERIRVVHSESKFGNEGQVIQLQYGFEQSRKLSLLRRNFGKRDRMP
jgi:hypothetical protein